MVLPAIGPKKTGERLQSNAQNLAALRRWGMFGEQSDGMTREN